MQQTRMKDTKCMRNMTFVELFLPPESWPLAEPKQSEWWHVKRRRGLTGEGDLGREGGNHESIDFAHPQWDKIN